MPLIQGPFNPTQASAINVGNPISNNWILPTGTFFSDNTYASAILNSAGNSNALYSYSYGFNIPPDATIVGIAATIEHRCNVANRAKDASVRIMQQDLNFGLGTEQASGQFWETTNTVYSYGSSSNLWGRTLTPADINATGFGLGLNHNFGVGGSTGFVNSMQMSVYYNLATSVTGCSLYIYGHQPINTGCTLFEWGYIAKNSGMTLYEAGHLASNSGITLYVSGVGFSQHTATLYIGALGDRIEKGMTLYLKNPGSDSGMPLVVWGKGFVDVPDSVINGVPRDGSIYLYIEGQGKAGSIPLYTSGYVTLSNNTTLYTLAANTLSTRFASGIRDWTIGDLSAQPLLWLKADAIGSGDGTPISTWFDSTIHHNDFSQSSSTNKPLLRNNIVNNLPVVRFDGIDDLLTNTAMPSAVQPVHYTFVLNPKSPTATSNWFQNNQAFIQSNAPVPEAFMFGGSNITQTGLIFDSFHVHTCLWSGVQSSWYIDGGSLKTGDASTKPFDTTFGLHKINDSAFPTAYDLPELAIFDYALHPFDRQQVEGYLAWKYGLQGNLPVGHIFRNSKPTVQTVPNPIGVTLVIPNVSAVTNSNTEKLYTHGF